MRNYCTTLPLKKLIPSFPATPPQPSTNWYLSSPAPLSEHLVRGSHPPPPLSKEKWGGMHTMSSEIIFRFFLFLLKLRGYHFTDTTCRLISYDSVHLLLDLSENPQIMVRHRFRNNLIELLKFPRVLVSSLGWYLPGTGRGFVKYKSSPESDSIFFD